MGMGGGGRVISKRFWIDTSRWPNSRTRPLILLLSGLRQSNLVRMFRESFVAAAFRLHASCITDYNYLCMCIHHILVRDCDGTS
jgi:hypothetical protein